MSSSLAVRFETVSEPIFDKSMGLMRPQDVADQLGISVRTVYDWRHRPWRRQTPEDLFLKFNGQLFIRIDVLRSWIAYKAARSNR